MLITCVILTLLIYKGSKETKIRDHFARIESLTPDQSAFFGGTPATITCGLFIRDFPQFDPIRGTFITDATVWFIFDPRLISMDRIGQFTFEQADIIKKSEPNVRIFSNSIFVRYDMRMRFNMSFDYRDFPFDGHRLNFTIINYFFSPAEATFTGTRSNLIINKDINIPGWYNIDRRVLTGYSQENIETQEGHLTASYPRISFSFDFGHIGSRHIFSIFLPLLLIFFIALLTFSLDPEGRLGTQIITLDATAITALIAYRFVIESISPQVGYFMASDYIFITFLMTTCAIFLVNIFSRITRGYIKGLLALLFQATVILTFYLAIY